MLLPFDEEAARGRRKLVPVKPDESKRWAAFSFSMQLVQRHRPSLADEGRDEEVFLAVQRFFSRGFRRPVWLSGWLRRAELCGRPGSGFIANPLTCAARTASCDKPPHEDVTDLAERALELEPELGEGMCEPTSSPNSCLSLLSLRTPSTICVLVGDACTPLAFTGVAGGVLTSVLPETDSELER